MIRDVAKETGLDIDLVSGAAKKSFIMPGGFSNQDINDEFFLHLVDLGETPAKGATYSDLVSAKRIKAILGVETHLSTWMNRLFYKYGFVEGEDYIKLKSQNPKSPIDEIEDFLITPNVVGKISAQPVHDEELKKRLDKLEKLVTEINIAWLELQAIKSINNLK